MDFIFKVKRMPSKTKWLNKNLGGTWRYGGYRGWWCDDGRCVRYTAPSLDEFDNPYGYALCWLDTPNQKTVLFNWKPALRKTDKLDKNTDKVAEAVYTAGAKKGWYLDADVLNAKE